MTQCHTKPTRHARSSGRCSLQLGSLSVSSHSRYTSSRYRNYPRHGSFNTVQSSFGFVGNRNALHSRFNAVPALRPFGVRRGRPPAVCGPPCAATSCHSKLFGSISFVSFSFPLDLDLILHATPCALKLLDAHGPVEPARVQARCTLENNDTSLHARAVG